MSFSDELKRIRQRTFLSQEAFAQEVSVSFSTVNRWESERTIPNLAAMKNIKAFCERNNLEYSILEEEWLNLRTEDRK
jgi:putative transcriptional regulator